VYTSGAPDRNGFIREEDAEAVEWIARQFPNARWSAPGERYVRIRHPFEPDPAAGLSADGLPRDLLFFDLETLGFLGHPIFLIGCLRRGPRAVPSWEVVQFLARDYLEEQAILQAFCRLGRHARRWVSFNGKSFDLPNLRCRSAYYGLPRPEPAEHLDLLHPARRIYRKVLPDCRLQTLESRLFGRYRFRDLVGFEVPAAYHAFVRGGDPEVMGRILLHNRSDLASLARLFLHLEQGEAAA
jgi:uncharacterized protein YprB with RNaseH-like and TPR domain